MPAEPAQPDPEARLHVLDAEIERVQRRLHAVEQGLAQVESPATEAEQLRVQLAELNATFVATYREWQAAEST